MASATHRVDDDIVIAARDQRLLLDVHKVRKALSGTTAFGARRSARSHILRMAPPAE
jgi:hypothetical protein